jgi:Cu2+-exporting ATPase
MNMIPALAADCAHCAAKLRPGQGRFCCEGCEGAHALVSGLGLDGFYRRREAAAGALRPVLVPAASVLRQVEERDGLCRIELLLSGLHCGACVWLVEQALAAEPDVLEARVTLSQHRLALRWRGRPERADAFAALLGRLGFAVAPWSAACLRATEDAEGQRLLRALGLATFGALNVMLISFAVWAGTGMGEATRGMLHWVAAAIALPTIAVAGLPFFRPAWTALRAGRPSMDLAVSLGVLAAAGMSLSEAMRGGPYVWFDSATALLALLLAGRLLDRAARAGPPGRGRAALAPDRRGAAAPPRRHAGADPGGGGRGRARASFSPRGSGCGWTACWRAARRCSTPPPSPAKAGRASSLAGPRSRRGRSTVGAACVLRVRMPPPTARWRGWAPSWRRPSAPAAITSRSPTGWRGGSSRWCTRSPP